MLSRVARPFWSLAAILARAGLAPRRAGLALPLAVLVATSCASEGEGRPDSELGNLVISPSTEVEKVELDTAASSAGALLTAVQLPHTWLGERLGAHRIGGTSWVEVREGGQVVSQLSDVLHIDFDGEDRFAATLDTSNEYGRHAVYDGVNLFLRPRYGLYHKRAPQTETEAADIRTEMAAVAGDYLTLLARGLEVSDRGAKTRDGRAVRQIELKDAPSPRKLPAEVLTQKLWRDSIDVKTLSGQVDLDIETGAPVYIQFEGSIVFKRDGRSFQMFLKAERSILNIDHTRAVESPAEEETLTIGIRRRELDERDSLLRNIAPPARRAPTPAATQEPAP